MSPKVAQSNKPTANPGPPQQSTIKLMVDGQLVTAKLVSTVRQEVEKVPSVVTHATLLIDASGSMLTRVGGATNETCFDLVMQYMRKLMQDVLQPTDLLTVAFFNTKYRQVYHSTPVKTVLLKYNNLKVVGDEHLKEYGGGTMLYDSTSTALASMKRTEEKKLDAKGNTSATDANGSTILRTMMVFTDGGDAGSVMKLSDLVMELAKPGFGNFHYLCLVAGADSTAATLKESFASVFHAKIIPVSDCSSSSITKVFGAAETRMRTIKTKLVEELKLIIVNKNKNAQPSMGHVLGHVAETMILSGARGPNIGGSSGGGLKSIAQGALGQGKHHVPNSPKPKAMSKKEKPKP